MLTLRLYSILLKYNFDVLLFYGTPTQSTFISKEPLSIFRFFKQNIQRNVIIYMLMIHT